MSNQNTADLSMHHEVGQFMSQLHMLVFCFNRKAVGMLQQCIGTCPAACSMDLVGLAGGYSQPAKLCQYMYCHAIIA